MAKVYIIHGYTASPEANWFPWLEEELGKIGVDCQRLDMPDSNAPQAGKWLDHLNQQLEVDNQTILIGHSLGCIAALNFIAKNYAKPAGAILVSGFYQPLETLPELTPFSNLYAVLPPVSALNAYVIAAQDDEIVPHRYSDNLAKHLNAHYIRLPQGGHFLDREGWTRFPLVLELVQKLLPQAGKNT